jgi:hypothetical protein
MPMIICRGWRVGVIGIMAGGAPGSEMIQKGAQFQLVDFGFYNEQAVTVTTEWLLALHSIPVVEKLWCYIYEVGGATLCKVVATGENNLYIDCVNRMCCQRVGIQ